MATLQSTHKKAAVKDHASVTLHRNIPALLFRYIVDVNSFVIHLFIFWNFQTSYSSESTSKLCLLYRQPQRAQTLLTYTYSLPTCYLITIHLALNTFT